MPEIAAIEPFHGETLAVYKRQHGRWQPVWWESRNFGHGVWIVVIVLLTLAVSSLVKYRWAARGALFALFFVLWGFATAANLVTGSRWGSLLNPVSDIRVVVLSLFGVPDPRALPVAACWLALAAVCAASIAVLARTLRAHEEIR